MSVCAANSLLTIMSLIPPRNCAASRRDSAVSARPPDTQPPHDGGPTLQKSDPMSAASLSWRLPYFMPLAVALASATLAGCGQSNGAPEGHGGGMPPATVAVQKLAAANVPAVYEYVGQTAGSRDVEVRARVSGILLKRNFN